MALAYADPPYPGLARRHYGCEEVDHRELLSRLDHYDGWALSTSAAALPDVLARAVAQGLDVRVGVWRRPPRPHATAAVLNAWEAVIYARARATGHADQVTDVYEGAAPRRRTTLPGAVIGAKPPGFCEWVFRLLGAAPGDTLDDLFPGSGIVGRCWRDYVGEPSCSSARTHVVLVDGVTRRGDVVLDG